ncbi:hypothetical protein H8K35_14480 [Undibacterium sp. LX40W]|uniref:Uncharacterized protein n=1 Tax=Undibacterium nitidum TaxID=2762298 RepID=A0A923HYJ4_9BURK|nr:MULTISPECIES: hypothetical protein [Undibacterium]MBC3882596.1 hypothetical protein [Undibacterium nitidum]MBC3892877.1 hypothetical protein [Undibacterium sp. LX40W]
MAIIAIFMVVQGLDFEPLQSTAIAWGSAFIIISVAIALLDRRFRRQHLNSHLNKIVYALTDQRALCIHANQITSNTSFALRELQIVEKRYNKDGSGDLIFKKETAIDDENDTQIIEHGFIGIVKLDEVEKLIRGSKAEFLLSAHDPQSTSI